MSLYIKSEQTGDVAVLQCTGRIVRGEALRFLKCAVTGLHKPRVVVLDLSAVEMLDGGGLGMLVFLHRWTRDNGIQLKLVNPSEFVREMLDRTRLSCVFDISSVDDAVEILCRSQHVRQDVTRAVA
jgi:anti-anti-sigma factor